MAVRIQKSQPQFTLSCPSWWNSNEQQISESLPNNLSFKVESTPQLYREAKHLGLQLLDHESSSAQSSGQSQNEVGAVGGTNSQDQCISSESGQTEICGKGVEGKMKTVFLLNSPEIVFNPSQVDYCHSMARGPYTYADPYYSGLFASYGRQAIIQPQLGPQMAGMTTCRVPLPLDLTDDGPIYVNAKQYHGILRRRQSRAKLEAQNKVVKTRKPYLHESRHRHALNRVRGSGGRFLSAKKSQNPDLAPTTGRHCVSTTIHLHQNNGTLELENCRSGTTSATGKSGTSNTVFSEVNSVSNGDFSFWQADHRFSATTTHIGGGMQTSGGLKCGGI